MFFISRTSAWFLQPPLGTLFKADRGKIPLQRFAELNPSGFFLSADHVLIRYLKITDNDNIFRLAEITLGDRLCS